MEFIEEETCSVMAGLQEIREIRSLQAHQEAFDARRKDVFSEAGEDVPGSGQNGRNAAEEANALLADESGRAALRAEPVFNAPVSMLRPASAPQARELERFEILAYRIPALSPAMGIIGEWEREGKIGFKMIPLEAVAEEKTDGTTKKIWPTRPAPYEDRWLHSDIKNMAYRYVYKVYERMCEIISPQEHQEASP